MQNVCVCIKSTPECFCHSHNKTPLIRQKLIRSFRMKSAAKTIEISHHYQSGDVERGNVLHVRGNEQFYSSVDLLGNL